MSESTADAFPVRPTTARTDLVRVFGWWFVAEQYLRHMRTYLTTEVALGIGTPALYVLAFGTGLGLVVDANAGGIDGVPYLTFLAPALLLSAALLTASQQYTYDVYSGLKWQPIIVAMASTAIAPWHVVGGILVTTLVRVIPSVVVFLAVMALVGAVPEPTGLLLLPIAWLLVASALPIMAWVSAQREDRGQLNFVERFVVMPLVLFSGTYYPIEVLPTALQGIAWASPLWHAVELGRAATYGHVVAPWLVVSHLGVLIAFATVGAVLSERILRKRLTA